MTIKLTIVPLARGVGVELPREILDRLGVDRGGVLHVSELPDGIKLTPNDPALEEQVQVADGLLREDRDVIKRLIRY